MSEARAPISQRAVLAEARVHKLEQELASSQEKAALAEERAVAAEQNLRAIGEQVRAEQEHLILLARQATLDKEEQLQALTEQLHLQQARHEKDRSESEQLAYRDPLTGLPNQNLLRHALELTLKSVRAREQTAALLLVDLDRFQALNRMLGRAQGDQLLCQVAERLGSQLPPAGVLARRGEDEFVIVVTVSTARSDNPVGPNNASVLARNLAQQLQQALAAPFTAQGESVTLGASIGVSCAPGDADTADDLLEHAEQAVRAAKASGRRRSAPYSQAMSDQAERELTLEVELRKALELQEFEVLYEPVVELPRGLMVGALASLRWNHPQRGPQEAAEFLPVLERTGLIGPLGNWVLQEACAQVRRLKSGFVVVELLARQLLDPALGATAMRAVTESRIKPESLVLTVGDEAAEALPEALAALLAQAAPWGLPFGLHQHGARLSLATLQAKPLQYLRLARPLVERSLHDEATANVCKGLLAVSRQLGLMTLAGGADSPTHVRLLAAHGCQLASGAYFAKAPVNGEELVALKRQTWKV